MRALKFFVLFLIVFSCVEPYEFTVDDTSPALVVEGYISDKSFTESLNYPSDGRYFSIRLTNTSDVTNVRPVPVLGATIFLLSSANDQWSYEASTIEPGVYELRDPSFKALQGTSYKIQISKEEEIFESSWETIPDTDVPPIGNVAFRETENQRYVVESGENVLRNIKEIETHISIGENAKGSPIYYRWKFSPMWVYIAPLSPSSVRPGYICWVRGTDYLKTFALQADKAGGYDKPLFTIPTLNNEKILDDFSVLIQQFAMTEDFFSFWNEMYEQNEGNVLVDKPPFNLKTNIQSISGSGRAVGFFGVVQEQATRWYFSAAELSYIVENTWRKSCETVYGPPGRGDCPEEPNPAFADCACKYCPRYPSGISTNVRPSWWRD